MSMTMPVLHKICSQGKVYDDVLLLHINHDMKNSYCFSAMMKKKFGKVIQIGASYSSSTALDRKPFEDGIYYYAIQNRDKTFSLQRSEVPLRIRSYSFVDAMDMLITAAVAKDILPEIRRGMRLFIIEDGGYHSQTIDNLEEIYPELIGSIIGSVEQTTSGTRILSSKTHYSYPSVSIARSEIKMCLESVFIGQKIVEELSSFIAYTNQFLNYRDVMMIGYGIFGRAVTKKLEGYGCSISIYDTDEVICRAARKEGYPAFERISPESFRDDQILIAMTGCKSYGLCELEHYINSAADNIILSSGSSKDIEFRDIKELIQDPGDSGLKFSLEEIGPYHERYSVTKGNRRKCFWLIANGMPVNFCREGSISLTDRMIDLIFAELLLCAEAVIDSEAIPNGLYLLGDSDAPVHIDEWALLREWFALNKLNTKDIMQCLYIHPCKDYLRRETFRKMSSAKFLS